jgi:phytoene desaturase
MADTKTVAIIGAGMAGLCAAKRLCAAGVSVRLFEANAKVGGCCASTRIGGYSFNDGAMYLVMPSMLDRLFEALGLDRERLLPLRRIGAIQSTTLPDGSVVDIGNAAQIAVHSARGSADTARLRVEVEEFLKSWEPVRRFFVDDVMVRPLALAHLLAKIWPHLLKLRGTAGTGLRASFSNESVRAAFGGALLYAGAPPDKLPAAMLLGLVSMLRDGLHVPKGGMGRITEVLADAVRTQGGRIHLDSAVRRIVVRNGRACAIETDHEGVIEVDAVLSTVSAMHTYATLLSAADAPARMLRRVRRAPLSHRSFVLQLGLANRIAPRSYANYALPWLGEQSQFFEPRGGEPICPMYMVPTTTLPELAPAGGSIVEMFPSIDRNMTPDDWSEARKEEVAAQAIGRLRREHEIDIAVSRILSPKEYRDGAHLYGGALYGLAPSAAPAALFKHRTPLRGLYQAGQTTWPGFGIAGAGLSGVFASETMLRDKSF